MTRTVLLFEDGTALVDGIEADALGDAGGLPFLSERARLSAARAALADDDREAAEAVSARGVVSPSDEDAVTVTFVAPPDWDGLGDALWDPVSGAAHAVFHEATMLVDGAAVRGCVGLPFQDAAARRECAAWCLRNGLEHVALRVSRTPVGGEAPHCTWPDLDLDTADRFDRPPPECDDIGEPALGETSDVAAEGNVQGAGVPERAGCPELYGEVLHVPGK